MNLFLWSQRCDEHIGLSQGCDNKVRFFGPGGVTHEFLLLSQGCETHTGLPQRCDNKVFLSIMMMMMIMMIVMMSDGDYDHTRPLSCRMSESTEPLTNIAADMKTPRCGMPESNELHAQIGQGSKNRKCPMPESMKPLTQIDAGGGQSPLEDACLERPRMQEFNYFLPNRIWRP